MTREVVKLSPRLSPCYHVSPAYPCLPPFLSFPFLSFCCCYFANYPLLFVSLPHSFFLFPSLPSSPFYPFCGFYLHCLCFYVHRHLIFSQTFFLVHCSFFLFFASSSSLSHPSIHSLSYSNPLSLSILLPFLSLFLARVGKTANIPHVVAIAYIF